MSRLFENVIEGATAGGIIGAALDTIFVIGATVIAGPVGLVSATEVVASKTAICTLVGGGAGVVKTIEEEKEK